jgi:hypothetical protein
MSSVNILSDLLCHSQSMPICDRWRPWFTLTSATKHRGTSEQVGQLHDVLLMRAQGISSKEFLCFSRSFWINKTRPYYMSCDPSPCYRTIYTARPTYHHISIRATLKNAQFRPVTFVRSV